MNCFYNKNCISVYESKKIKTNENKSISYLNGKYNKAIDKYAYIFYKTTKDNSPPVGRLLRSPPVGRLLCSPPSSIVNYDSVILK
jgi:hypothetical protein